MLERWKLAHTILLESSETLCWDSLKFQMFWRYDPQNANVCKNAQKFDDFDQKRQKSIILKRATQRAPWTALVVQMLALKTWINLSKNKCVKMPRM